MEIYHSQLCILVHEETNMQREFVNQVRFTHLYLVPIIRKGSRFFEERRIDFFGSVLIIEEIDIAMIVYIGQSLPIT